MTLEVCDLYLADFIFETCGISISRRNCRRSGAPARRGPRTEFYVDAMLAVIERIARVEGGNPESGGRESREWREGIPKRLVFRTREECRAPHTALVRVHGVERRCHRNREHLPCPLLLKEGKNR
jgi:hypothetical protein